MKKNLSIFVIIILLFSTSCKKNIREIISTTEKASFIIYTYDEFGTPSGSGSGFFISDAIGLTNYHVLDGATKAIIITTDGSKFEIENIISSDKEMDIIKFQLKSSPTNTQSLTLTNETPQKGDVIYCLSNPLRLENTFTNGIISNFQNDNKSIQFTAPISPGSSGGAVLNENGEVIALATSSITRAQNLNFGTYLNNEILNSITNDDFTNRNPKFSKRDNFIILNLKSDNDPFTTLNAIEFGDNSTTLYMSFTNLHLTDDNSVWGLYQDFKDKKEDNDYFTDLKTNIKYHITSSTLGTQENLTTVPLGTTLRYKQHFPKINSKIDAISIGDIKDSRSPHWSNIDLKELGSLEKFDLENFQTHYAFSALGEGKISNAKNLFLDIINNDPENNEALSTLGVLEYLMDNNNDALMYFTLAINSSPNTSVSYVNRHYVHLYQNNIQEALTDISKAINISPDQSEYYKKREKIYLRLGNKEKAREDFFKADDISSKIYDRKPLRSWDSNEERVYDYILDLRVKQDKSR